MASSMLWIATLLSTASATSMLKFTQTSIAGQLDPVTSSSIAWALAAHGIAEKLFTVNCGGYVVPQVGQTVQRQSTYTWEVTLTPNYKFSDGTTVTAQHVADSLSAINGANGPNGAKASLGAMTMAVVDDTTLTITSERATPVMASVLAEWPFVIFTGPSTARIFTGPYVADSLTADLLTLSPNSEYPNAAQRSSIEVHRVTNGTLAADMLAAGTTNMAFHLPVGELPDLRATNGITVKTFLAGYQYMMFHNTRRAPLMDANVRQAIDTALNRNEMTQTVQAGQGTRSFYPQGTPYYVSDSNLDGDLTAAGTALTNAGWVLDTSTNIRSKDGTQLAVNLVAYPQRPSLVAVQPGIAATLTSLGFVVTETVTSADSWDELDAITANNNFDLLMWAQHTMPAGDPAWFMNAFFRTQASRNMAGFSDPTIDNLLDALDTAEEDADRVAASTAAMSAIIADAPVSMLYTPGWHVGLDSSMSAYAPYGSDYYVINAETGLSTMGQGSCAAVSGVILPSAADTETSGARRAMLTGLSIASLMLFATMYSSWSI